LLNEVKDELQKEVQLLWENNQCKGLAALCTGAGKSKIAVNIVSDVQHKGNWLLVVPTEKLRDENWADEFSKWKRKTYYNKIGRACYASLSKIDLSQYAGIILDEAHNLTEANSKPFRNLTPEQLKNLKILALTATPPTEEEKVDIFEQLGLDMIRELKLDKGVELGIVAPYEIIIVETVLDDMKKTSPGGSKNKPFMTTEFKNYHYKTRRIQQIRFSGKPVPKFLYLDRMRMLYDLQSKTDAAQSILKSISKDKKTLIFAGSIRQAEELEKQTFHSKTDDKDLTLFQKDKIKRLSCVQALNEGVNISNLDVGVVVQLNSNPRNLIQRVKEPAPCYSNVA
jgi:superfamily II DNA or RNA helicase